MTYFVKEYADVLHAAADYVDYVDYVDSATAGAGANVGATVRPFAFMEVRSHLCY